MSNRLIRVGILMGWILFSGAASAAETTSDILIEIVTTRKPELDLNGDGKIDFVREYGPDGKIKRFSVDGNSDGNFEYEEEHEGPRIGAREDRNLDGRFDRWVAVWLDEANDEYSRQEWLDTNGDGKVDFWIVEETMLDSSGVMHEESRDTNADGNPDQYEKFVRPRWLSQAPGISNVESDAISGAGSIVTPPGAPSRSMSPPGITAADRSVLTAGCGHSSSSSPDAVVRRLIPELRRVVGRLRRGIPADPDWRPTVFGPRIDLKSCGSRSTQIEAAVSASVKRGLSCLARFNRTLMCRYAVFLADRMPEIRCSNEASFDHLEEELPDVVHGGTTGTDACAIGAAPGREVWLSRNAFTPACGTLPGVLFHEFLHNFGVTVTGPHDPSNPLDGVYGCEEACFPAPGSSWFPRLGPACRIAH